MKIFFLIIFTISFSVPVFSQIEEDDKSLIEAGHKGLIDQVMEYIREGSELFPAQTPPLSKVRGQLETQLFLDNGKEVTFNYRGNYGFGFNRFFHERPGGYCSFFAEGFALRDEYARYKLGLRCEPDVWPRIREQAIKEWKARGGPAFTEKDGIFVETADDSIIEKYKTAVSAKLGPMKPVTIPANLKKSYEHLIDPITNSGIGDRCVEEQSLPDGKTAILQIITAKRIDILENILRGYNPGGRIYAASALLKMQKGGLKLDPVTLDTIERLKDLDSVIIVCQGDKKLTENGKDALKLFSL